MIAVAQELALILSKKKKKKKSLKNLKKGKESMCLVYMLHALQ